MKFNYSMMIERMRAMELADILSGYPCISSNHMMPMIMKVGYRTAILKMKEINP